MLQIVPGGFLLNGERTPRILGRSSFKLSNIITYHYAGKGGGTYSLGYARRWVEYNQALFGEHVFLRVFLETGGWDPRSEGMFGSAPQDQGFWNRMALRDGERETQMHPRGNKVLEWFFKTSQETGVGFELVIDATLKHDNIPAGEIDHVIRQVGVRMGELSLIYPRALILPNCRNEWDAHNGSGHTLSHVNMWASRWSRDKYTPPEMRPVVCPGGADVFTYDVGPESGKFAMGLIHPLRSSPDREWWEMPNLDRVASDSRGQPFGFNESMYYVEQEDRDRAGHWYKGGWTADFGKYTKFAETAIEATGYFVFHDEKGVQCDKDWPRGTTRLESHFGAGSAPPPPPPPPPDDKEDDDVPTPTPIDWFELLPKIMEFVPEIKRAVEILEEIRDLLQDIQEKLR